MPSTTTGDDPTDGTSTTGGPGATSVTPGTSSGGMDSTGGESSSSGGGVTGDDSNAGVCGNNIIEGDEACDLNQLNGETCQSLGYEGGNLGCLLDCTDYSYFGCFICGNGVIDQAEDCESVVPEGVTCESMGFEGGTIACGTDCLWDTSECQICGDGIQQGAEQCDGIDFGGETCASLGFDMGNLACNLAACAFNYAGCSGGMYVQNFDASLMMPAEFTVGVIDPWFVDATMPIAGPNSARSGALVAGGITNMTLAASYPAGGNVSFSHKESTAAGFDFLEFWVDGVMVMSWSGINVAATYMQPVAAGGHTFEWRFNRLGFINGGIDAVFVDDIVLDGGIPM